MADTAFAVRDARPGFLRVDNDLYDRFGAQLGPYGLAVYMALCRFANRESECWPSYSTIAKGTGMSRRKVIYEIKKLEELGAIEVQRNRDTSNVFVLLDTGAQRAPQGVHDVHPSGAQRAPKQSLKNNRSSSEMNKMRTGYIPEAYREIIIG